MLNSTAIVTNLGNETRRQASSPDDMKFLQKKIHTRYNCLNSPSYPCQHFLTRLAAHKFTSGHERISYLKCNSSYLLYSYLNPLLHIFGECSSDPTAQCL